MDLAPMLTEFVLALRARDPGACIDGQSALELHLGRVVSSPLHVRVRRAHRVPRTLATLVVLARRSRPSAASMVRGVPAAPLRTAFLETLTTVARCQNADLLADAAHALGAEDRAWLARHAGGRGCAPEMARAAFLVSRATGLPIPARPRRGPVLLRPGGLACGLVDPGTGVRVNVPYGALGPEEEQTRFMRALQPGLRRAERVLLLLAQRGVGLDAELAQRAAGVEAGASALRRLEATGLLARHAGLLRPVAPLDRTSASSSNHPPLLALPVEDLLAHLDASDHPAGRRDALRLRLALGHPDAAERLLEEAPRALERGEQVEVEQWVEAFAVAHPAVAETLRVTVLEHTGQLGPALTRARDLLRRGHHPLGAWHARLDVARLAWRAGRALEAEAALRVLERTMRRGAPSLLAVEVRLLRGTMALARGDLGAARRALRMARGVAEASGDDEASAQVLRRLGTLEARAGRPAEASGAYRAALAALRRSARPREPRLEAVLLSNLATTESWLGRTDEAEGLYRQALERRAHQPLEALNTRAALALLDASRGRAPSGGRFGPLVEEAERLGDARLRAELGVYRVEELVLRGAVRAADDALARVRTALAELGGAERILDALAVFVEACVQARRGRASARAGLLAGVEQLVACGARYHAARAARRAASAHVWLGDEEAAAAAIAHSAQLADGAGIVLGDPSADVVGLALAALRGRGAARAHARAALEGLGHGPLEAALRAEGRSDLVRAWIEGASAPRPGVHGWALGPDGWSPMTSSERDALCARPDTVVLDRSRRLLFVHGGPPRALGRMRHVEPMLAHLAARRPESVSLDELARVVWQQRRSRSVEAAITTSIARARRLLGAAGGWLVTHVGDGVRAYAVDSSRAFYRLDSPSNSEAIPRD